MLRRLTREILPLVLVCVIARATGAQVMLEVGGRARVQTRSHPSWTYGRVVSVDSGGVLLEPCPICEGSEVPRTHILTLQASAGPTGRTYAREGAVVGAVIGAVWGHAEVQRHGGFTIGGLHLSSCRRGCSATAGEVLGGLGVALAGLTVGAFFHHEGWETVHPWPN